MGIQPTHMACCSLNTCQLKLFFRPPLHCSPELDLLFCQCAADKAQSGECLESTATSQTAYLTQEVCLEQD